MKSAAAAKARADKHSWLAERGYRVAEVGTQAIEADIGRVLDTLAETVAAIG